MNILYSRGEEKQANKGFFRSQSPIGLVQPPTGTIRSRTIVPLIILLLSCYRRHTAVACNQPPFPDDHGENFLRRCVYCTRAFFAAAYTRRDVFS